MHKARLPFPASDLEKSKTCGWDTQQKRLDPADGFTKAKAWQVDSCVWATGTALEAYLGNTSIIMIQQLFEGHVCGWFVQDSSCHSLPRSWISNTLHSNYNQHLSSIKFAHIIFKHLPFKRATITLGFPGIKSSLHPPLAARVSHFFPTDAKLDLGRRLMHRADQLFGDVSGLVKNTHWIHDLTQDLQCYNIYHIIYKWKNIMEKIWKNMCVYFLTTTHCCHIIYTWMRTSWFNYLAPRLRRIVQVGGTPKKDTSAAAVWISSPAIGGNQDVTRCWENITQYPPWN